MDSDTDSSNTNKPWQWIMASPTRMVGLILLVLALVLLLALMVLVSQKPPKKIVQNNIPQPSPTTLSTPFPDPTKDWKTYNEIAGISFKYPPEATASTTLPITRNSAGVQVSPNKELAAAEQPTLIIQAGRKSAFGFRDWPLKDFMLYKYTTIASSSATRKVITKPIEILIGGLRGYEYYIETDQFNSVKGTYYFKLGKNRIIHLEKDDKFYIILSSLDERIEQILGTLVIND